MRPRQNLQPQKPFFPPLVALYLVSVFVTLPFVNALHRHAEDLAQLEGCRQCATPLGQRLPLNQRQHNQSQCITCQLIANSQKHALVLADLHKLHLDLSPLPVTIDQTHLWSVDHTRTPLARGPPSIA